MSNDFPDPRAAKATLDDINARIGMSASAISIGDIVEGAALARSAIALVESNVYMNIEDEFAVKGLIIRMLRGHDLIVDANEIEEAMERDLEYISDEETKEKIMDEFKESIRHTPRPLYTFTQSKRWSPTEHSSQAEQPSGEPRTKDVMHGDRYESGLQMRPLQPAHDIAVSHPANDAPKEPIERRQSIDSSAVNKTPKYPFASGSDMEVGRTNSMPQMSLQDASARLHRHGGSLQNLEHSDLWFNHLTERTLPFIRGPNGSFHNGNYTRVKVAVLDTGVGAQKDRKFMQMFDAMVQKSVSCFEDKSKGIEGDLHGINAMYQLSKVCPNAKLYSYRVAAKSALDRKPEPDEAAVVAALRLAIEDKVDIVTMSFGWKDWNEAVQRALRDAQNAGILLFASSSNSGAHEGMEYPARDDAVIAADAADAFGNSAPFNSSHNTYEKKRYIAPGIGLQSVTAEKIEGTSYASPILAGVAALFLEFAKQEPLVRTEVLKFMKKKEGMQVLLDIVAVQKTTDPFFYVIPWRLFYDKSGDHGGDGGPSSRRYRVAGVIVDTLAQQFGANIGGEVFR